MSAKFVIAKREAVLKIISAELPDDESDSCSEVAIERRAEGRGLLRQLANIVRRRLAYQH